jgi:hypothetical protein
MIRTVWSGRVTRPIVVGLALSLLPALAGCSRSGGEPTTVEGAVLLGGKPVEGAAGNLTCVTATGLRITAPVDQTGHYLLYNPPEGPLKIGVSLVEYMTLEQAFRSGNKPPKRLTPAKYADPEKSGLAYTVVPGKQTYDIDLAP